LRFFQQYIQEFKVKTKISNKKFSIQVVMEINILVIYSRLNYNLTRKHKHKIISYHR